MSNSLVNSLSSFQAWEVLKKDADACLIDVRSPEEWQETGVADLSSINKSIRLLSFMFFTPHIHNNDNFMAELESIVPEKEVKLLFICKSGGRSLKAAEAAINQGYKNCYNVEDGFVGNMFDNNLKSLDLNGWINSDLPRRAL